jgi:hypothetical protein
MKHNEQDLTAYCGLYCGDCVRFQSKASDLSDELLDEIEKQHLSDYANVKKTHTKEFENFDTLISTLKAISKFKCDLPCRLGGDGCEGSCEIIKCVKDKSIAGCWECKEFETCGKFDFLKPFHGEGPINNLRLINKYGLSNWAPFRDKCYPWL